MLDRRINHDTISEEDYTIQLKNAPSSPEDDSPGDSEADAGAEFLMGLNYEVDEDDSDVNPPEQFKKSKRPVLQVQETAQVISSDQPNPWMDQTSSSDTH